MMPIDQLDLPHLPLESSEFAAEPFPYLIAARRKHGWLASCENGYVIHEHAAMRELFARDDRMRVYNDGVVEHMGASKTHWGRWMKRQIIAMPHEQHRRVRAAFASSFTPRFANGLRPHIRATMAELLNEWAPKGNFDFDEFASWFPISVMFSIIGAPIDRIASIKADLETLGLAFSMDRSLMPAVERAFGHMEAFTEDVISERERDSGRGSSRDLLDLMLEASDRGDITRSAVADLLLSFFIAAYDTTKVVLTTTMSLLIERPGTYRRCAEDVDYCRRVVEETLRYLGPSTALRVTTETIAFRDVLIPPGTMLFFPYSIAGRDPNTFPDGDTFDPDRDRDLGQRHIAFGLGQHMCIAQHIARVELQEALHLIAQRISEPKLVGESGWRPFPGIWGRKGLLIAFTPAEVA